MPGNAGVTSASVAGRRSALPGLQLTPAVRENGNVGTRRTRAVNAPDLIEAARTLVESGGAAPTQARLRRAVSTAYYATFHTLAASSADLFIGTERSPAWHRAYRALDHGRGR